MLTASDDAFAKLWDADDGPCCITYAGHCAAVWSAVFAACGTKIMTASADRSARVWDLQHGWCLRAVCGHGSWSRGMAWSAQGDVIFVPGMVGAQAWSLSTGECVLTMPEGLAKVLSIALC